MRAETGSSRPSAWDDRPRIDKAGQNRRSDGWKSDVYCQPRQTIKGMFLTQRRSKTEAAFITENIDRYEELFEICMNGDDAQFKKGITELQKAQNEYILQKERENG